MEFFPQQNMTLSTKCFLFGAFTSRCKCGLCFASVGRSVHVPDSRGRLLLYPSWHAWIFFSSALKFGGRMFTKSKCIPLEIVTEMKWTWILEGGSSILFFLPEWTNTQIKKTKKGGHLFKEKAENLRLKVPLKAFWQAGDYCVNDMKSVVLKTGESKWKTVKTKSKTVGKSGTHSRTLNSPAGYQFHETENVWMSAEKYQRRWMKSHQRYEQSYLYISFWSNLTNGYPLYHFTWLVG